MSFTFTEEITDEILDRLVREVGYVDVKVAQYRIDSEIPLDTYDFQDQEKFRLFFHQFSEYANERWKLATKTEWDFSGFPFRESSEIIKGLFRILKTGGPHGEDHSEDEATRTEERYRKGFQKGSNSLIIFCVVREDLRGEDVSSGFGVSEDILETKEISPFFEVVAWDDLIFIINPKTNTLYVIAYTATD